MPWRSKEAFREWYAKNKATVRRKQKQWVEKNKDKVRESSHRSYYKNKDQRKKAYEDLRHQAYLKLGRRCFVCGIRPSLRFSHFHHLEYFPDSVRRERPHKRNEALARIYEVLEHPERFILLCFEHHMQVEGFKKSIQKKLSQFPPQLQDRIILALYNKRLF